MEELIACKSCGKEISRKAKFCPHCGMSYKKSKIGMFIFLGIIVGIIFLFRFYIYDLIFSSIQEIQRVDSIEKDTFEIKIPPLKTYQIGERGPAGGIVFYDKGNFSNGWRYLETAPADTEIQNLRWGAYGYDVPGTQMDIGTGKRNTQIINNYLREYNESGRAAQICAQLNSGNSTDWFLPSKEELHWMYLNLHSKGLGSFKNARYWSSSQVDKYRAWYLHFGDNGRASNNYDKDRDAFFSGEIWTRAVRSF
jgi:hypothetical protein